MGLYRLGYECIVRHQHLAYSACVCLIMTFSSVTDFGSFVWLPLVRPSTEFPNEISYWGGITSFIGATIFEIGSIFLLLEAVNENRTGCFGWAVEELVGEEVKRWRLTPSFVSCEHHHANRRNLFGSQSTRVHDAEYNGDLESHDGAHLKGGQMHDRSWSWMPSIAELRGHYFHELGFLASLFQFLGASIFWIAGLTALPGIYNHLSGPSLNGAYWSPQVIGGSGFIISGLLFMLETQEIWYKPAFKVLGWHIGFWNFVGGLGFTLCPAFGYDAASWAVYQSSLATFWGSWAFMIGSTIQLYESLQKYPVDVVENF
jgi:hypothetical protein